MDKVIGEIDKSSVEKVRATLSEYKGQDRIDIRVFFLPDTTESDTWLPTKKGINIAVGAWPEFKQLIEKGDRALEGSKG